ncbi:hypothetical protein E4T44_13689 [Aureobasidium sp. EXF-8845]|nr:hypothetical protein E4T44_13689 [Aureobasidium sp. EXF-8845]
MLSKLHWQKRSNRKSQQSFEGHSLSPQASPELQPEAVPPVPSSRRPKFLSRVRSQRFSTANSPPETPYQGKFLNDLVGRIMTDTTSEVASNPVPKRHSYYQPAQPSLYDTTEVQLPV